MKMTRDDILEYFTYIKATGQLYWKKFKSSSMAAGREAGSITSTGYRVIKFNQKHYYTHRIIWFLENGYWPVYIDHIDHNRLNNKISNLRTVCSGENNKNRSIPSNNTSGCIGVCWHKRSKKWQAYIYVNNKRIFLGEYKDKKEAIKHRKEAEIKYDFHENHGTTKKVTGVYSESEVADIQEQ